MSALLSRYAESSYWLARYFERASSLARIFEVQTSFSRGRADDQDWAWIIALYSDDENFYERHEAATASTVTNYYVSDLQNPSSVLSSVRAARENARALRPLISTEMWTQANGFYNRLLALGASDFAEMRLSRTCDMIKHGCYDQIGVAESTLYRDESWSFFRMGLLSERADQISRLLDVRFARRATMGEDGEVHDLMTDFSYWTILLRSAAAYHAYRRVEPTGTDPDAIARFLIFDARFPRSVAFCIGEIQRCLYTLRSAFMLRGANSALEHMEIMIEGLETASHDDRLVERLHEFNDWVQGQLIALTSELGQSFFGHPPPEPDEGDGASQTQTQSSSPAKATG